MRARIEVKQTPEGKWGLYINDILIGDSKNQFDASHSRRMMWMALEREKEAI